VGPAATAEEHWLKGLCFKGKDDSVRTRAYSNNSHGVFEPAARGGIGISEITTSSRGDALLRPRSVGTCDDRLVLPRFG